MVWMARTGAQWRHLPDEYGKWNIVFRRYRRWLSTGVFDAMLDTFAEVVERDTSADMTDSTVVRAHHCAVGLKPGIRTPQGPAVRGAASQRSPTLPSSSEERRVGQEQVGTCRSRLSPHHLKKQETT